MNTRHSIIATALGEIIIVAAGDSVVGLYFPQHWHKPTAETLGARVDVADDPLLSEAATQVIAYLDGARTSFDLPIATSGDAFQERVWAMLREIPFGATTTYGELAERLGNKAMAQLVGQAVGRNPISIIIGCHRVIGRNGSLTGYAGGLRRKQMLLALEEPAPASVGRLF
jgi:methylated-DNA-[protein]-cysteine S-methyltransferase